MSCKQQIENLMYFLWIKHLPFFCVRSSIESQLCFSAGMWFVGSSVFHFCFLFFFFSGWSNALWIVQNNCRYFAKTWSNYMIWSWRHSVNVFSVSKTRQIPIFDSDCSVCHLNASSALGLTTLGRMLRKGVKYAQNRDHFYVILMFAVTSYTVHSKIKNCYTIHITRHITLKCSLWEKCIIIGMYLKVYLYSHDIYEESMHNKRFIILTSVLFAVSVTLMFRRYKW